VTDVIGVDLGGTKIAVARLHDRELSESMIEPTDRSGAEALIEQLADMIEACRGDEQYPVGGCPAA
jgi:glucokinase